MANPYLQFITESEPIVNKEAAKPVKINPYMQFVDEPKQAAPTPQAAPQNAPQDMPQNTPPEKPNPYLQFLDEPKDHADTNIPVGAYADILKAGQSAVQHQDNITQAAAFFNSPQGSYWGHLAANLHDSLVKPLLSAITQPAQEISNTVSGATKGIGEAIGDAFRSSNEAINKSPLTPAKLLSQAGAMLNGETILQKIGLPAQFDIPSVARLSPFADSLLKVAGGNVTHFADRMALGVGIDLLAGMGFDGLLAATPASKAVGLVDKLSTLTPEEIGIYQKQLLRAAKESPISHGELSVQDCLDQMKAAPGIKAGGPVSIYGDTKYVYQNGVVTPIGPASKTEKIADALEQKRIIDSFNDETPVELKDVLPTAGQKDPYQVGVFNRGWASALRSPQYAFPQLYEKAAQYESRAASLTNDLMTDFSAIKVGSKEAELVGQQADGVLSAEEWEHAVMNGDVTPTGLKKLDAWENMSNRAANLLGLKDDQRIHDYFTHAWENSKDVQLPVTEYINNRVTNFDKFLRERKGAQGYMWNIDDVANKYTEWVGKYIAKKENIPGMLQDATAISALDPIRGKVAEAYIHNLFGETNKVAAISLVKNLSSGLKSMFGGGSLGYNFSTALLNLTQAPLFGGMAIGVGNWIKGASRALMGLVGKDSEVVKLLADSGLVGSMGQTAAGKISGFWSKIPGMAKIAEHSGWFMDRTEWMNKASVYMGAYDSALDKIYAAKKLVEEGKNPSGLASWLSQRGINVNADAVLEAKKFARTQTVNTQIDMSRAGHSFLQNFPGADLAMMFLNFPMKMGEYIAHTAKDAATIIGRGLTGQVPLQHILSHPAVAGSIRGAMLYSALKGIEASTGISFDRVIGLKNFTPDFDWKNPAKSSPFINSVIQLLTSGQKVLDTQGTDPKAVDSALKNVLQLSGFPLTMPIWKIKSLIQAAQDNEGQTGKWQIKNPTKPNKSFSVDPAWYVIGHLTNMFTDQNEESYYNNVKDMSDENNKRMNIQAAINYHRIHATPDQAANLEKGMQLMRESHIKMLKLKQQLRGGQ